MIDQGGAPPPAQTQERQTHLRSVLMVEQGGRGGVADYTGCLAAALAQRGLAVTLATADDHLYPAMDGVRIVPVFGYVRGHCRAARLARRVGLGPVLNGIRFLLSLPKLVRLTRASEITHVQGWERVSLGLIATLLMRAAGAQLVVTMHNTFERRARSLSSVRIFPALARGAIVHTEADRSALARPATVIPHGHYSSVADAASPIEPEAAREALGIPADALVALLFGHLRPDKGLDDLLDAIAQEPAWTALIAGQEGGGLAKIGARLSNPVLAGRVFIQEGFQPIDAVGQFFAAADLVVIPYRRASQSGVLHLAYGFARPVAVYPVGGLAEAIVAGETGWVCAEATPSALAAVLGEAATLGRDELRRRGQAGQQWARERFDWRPIAEATEAVYLEALERSPA